MPRLRTGHAAQAGARNQALEVWVGDWTFTGTAKDGPSDKGYPVTWRVHFRWILGGFAVQTDQEWIANGITAKFLEVINFDPAKKSLIGNGYGDDGSGWTCTLTVTGDTWFESCKYTLPDGKTAPSTGRFALSPDHLSVTYTEEREQDGSKWVSFRGKGTKAPLGTRPKVK